MELARAMDTDGDGEIACAEFVAALDIAGKRPTSKEPVSSTEHEPVRVACENALTVEAPPLPNTAVVATRRVLLRLAPSLDSQCTEVVQADEAMVVLETRLSDTGQMRLRCNRGWASFVTEDDDVLFRTPSVNDADAVTAAHNAAAEAEAVFNQEGSTTQTVDIAAEDLETFHKVEVASDDIAAWLLERDLSDCEAALRRAMVETVSDLHFLASSESELTAIGLSSKEAELLWADIKGDDPAEPTAEDTTSAVEVDPFAELESMMGPEPTLDDSENEVVATPVAAEEADIETDQVDDLPSATTYLPEPETTTNATAEEDSGSGTTAAEGQADEEQAANTEADEPIVAQVLVISKREHARYCKKCKAVFEAFASDTKCPGAHPNFMYTVRTQAISTTA